MGVEQDNVYISSLNLDIQRCLDKLRVDEQIMMFVHIYSQLEDSLQSDNKIKRAYDYLQKKYDAIEFRQELEFYYTIVTGDEARVLYDPTVDYNPKYDMRNFMVLYKEITKIKNIIAKNLGYIKSKVMGTKDIMEGW